MTNLELVNAIDQLHSEAREISLTTAKYLALAWWHAENEYREETGLCSNGHSIDRRNLYSLVNVQCQCCRYFQSLTTRAKLSRVA